MASHSFYFDSGDADSNGTVQLRSGVRIDSVAVVEASIPVLWPALRSQRMYFFERLTGPILPVPTPTTDGSQPEDGPTVAIVLPDGSPTLTELLAWLKTALDAAGTHGAAYSVTVDSKTNRVTISTNTPTVQCALYAGPKGRNLLACFGWTGTWTWAVSDSLTSPYAARPAGANYVLVHSNLGTLVRRGVLDRGVLDHTDVIAVIPLSADFSGICAYQPDGPDTLELSPSTFSTISLTLVDPENGDRLDTLLGPHRWTARLKITSV